MAHRRGHWYVVGKGSSGERLYRADRIRKLTVGDEPGAFSKPADFDVRSVMDSQPWETGGEGSEEEAVVRFDAEVAWWAARSLGLDEPDGALETSIPYSNQDALVGWILSFGSSAEVLAPQGLREEIRTRVEAALEGASK